MGIQEQRGSVLIGKLGLDGHDRGARLIARSLREDGFEVIYTGIRHTPEEVASAAVEGHVDVIGLSLLSGAHNELVPSVLKALRQAGGSDIPIIIGGIIPEEDISRLKNEGICEVFTPGTPLPTILDVFRKAAHEYRERKRSG
ncbi:MAG: cobalamin B12-binding protein [Candidatus Brocadiaceae bacterium]|nr:cobalamin B12-binding protein [Candidatus Brocadiaceae bacterium]